MEEITMKSLLGDVEVTGENVYCLLREKALEFQGHVAMLDYVTSEQLTYGDILQNSDMAARHLVAMGFTRCSTLVLYTSNCLEYYVMAMAALRLGGKMVGLNFLLTSADVHHALQICDGDFVFTSKEVASNALKGSAMSAVKVIICREEHPGCVPYSSLLADRPGLPQLPLLSSLNVSKKDVGCILFSSGTTGLPKAVMLSHENMLTRISLAKMTGFHRSRGLVFTPFTHMIGWLSLLCYLTHGAFLVMMRRFDLENFLHIASHYKLEVLNVVPPIAVMLAKHSLVDKYDMTRVNAIVCGAAPVSHEILSTVCERLGGPHIDILQGYGMTETTGGITSTLRKSTRPPDIPPPPPGTVGLLWPGAEAKVVDVTTGCALGPNAPGEVMFRGPQVMAGYQNNPEATRAALDSQGWLHTGDIAYYDENGYFFIVDRMKELIKYKGYQVSPSELDAVILSHPGVADCGVVGLPDEVAGELPHAWVVPKAGAGLTENDIMNHVNERVAAFKRLRGGVRFVEQIPRANSGKILRRVMMDEHRKSKM